MSSGPSDAARWTHDTVGLVESDDEETGRRAGRPRGFLARLRASLTATREQLDAEDERRGRLTDTVAVEALREREPATVGGVLTAVTYPPAGGSPLLRARLFDGTGTIELVFLGRRTVPGIEPGRRLRATGTPTEENNGLVLYNPALDLVAAPTGQEA